MRLGMCQLQMVLFKKEHTVYNQCVVTCQGCGNSDFTSVYLMRQSMQKLPLSIVLHTPYQMINALLAYVIGRGGTSGNAKHIFNCYINMSFPC